MGNKLKVALFPGTELKVLSDNCGFELNILQGKLFFFWLCCG